MNNNIVAHFSGSPKDIADLRKLLLEAGCQEDRARDEMIRASGKPGLVARLAVIVTPPLAKTVNVILKAYLKANGKRFIGWEHSKNNKKIVIEGYDEQEAVRIFETIHSLTIENASEPVEDSELPENPNSEGEMGFHVKSPPEDSADGLA